MSPLNRLNAPSPESPRDHRANTEASPSYGLQSAPGKRGIQNHAAMPHPGIHDGKDVGLDDIAPDEYQHFVFVEKSFADKMLVHIVHIHHAAQFHGTRIEAPGIEVTECGILVLIHGFRIIERHFNQGLPAPVHQGRVFNHDSTAMG